MFGTSWQSLQDIPTNKFCFPGLAGSKQTLYQTLSGHDKLVFGLSWPRLCLSRGQPPCATFPGAYENLYTPRYRLFAKSYRNNSKRSQICSCNFDSRNLGNVTAIVIDSPETFPAIPPGWQVFASISALCTSSFLSFGLDADGFPGHGVCAHMQECSPRKLDVYLKLKVALAWFSFGASFVPSQGLHA